MVHLWDVEKANEIQALKGREQVLLSVSFSPEGRHALSSAADDSERLWQLPE